MDKYFYQNPEYKPTRMTKKELVSYLTAIQDECFDEKVAAKEYRIPNIDKCDFGFYYKRDAMKKTAFIFKKTGTDICGGMSQLAPFGRDKDPIKVVVALRLKASEFYVWTFDWNETFLGKNF